MSKSPTAQSVACALCGADCEAESRFCPHCGSPISTGYKGDDALTGQVVGDGYVLAERVGTDALSRTFRTAREGSSDDITVRVIHDQLARNARFIEGFDEAAKVATRLTHPGTLRVWASGKAELDGRDRLFVVTEAFGGRNLCAIVQVRGLLPVSQVLLIGCEVLDALSDAHRSGTVHGDLLPEHISIGATEEGEVRPKLTNFALGRLAAIAAPRVLSGGSYVGTSHYAAPELIRGEEPSIGTDIYSLGIILYEQLTGTRPFNATSSLVVEQMHLHCAPRPLREVAPNRGIGPTVEAVVMRALDKDPDRRFVSASDMCAALRQAREADAESALQVAVSQPERLVARTAILDATLTTALAPVAYAREDLGHPRGSVVLLFGGAGMGKTAVIRNVENRLEGGPVAILRVDGRRALTRPLEPFTSLARDALGLRRGAPDVVVRSVHKALSTRFQMARDEIVRLLDRVTGRPSSLNLTPDVIEREQVRALRSFIGRTVALRPTVLIVEDADAMDGASLRLTRDLMEASATLALSVIVSCRNDPWPDWSADYVTRLHVEGLDHEAARTLVKRRLAGQPVHPDALALALDWCKGSPLLLDLCARAMRRRELLEDRDGDFRARSTSQGFGGLRQLVSSALRDATPCARRWISCAALAGAVAEIDMLEAFESPCPNRDAVISTCLETGLVRRVDDAIAFDNEGVRNVVRAMVPDGDDRLIHTFVATWLREFDPPRAQLEVIAEHTLAGGDFVSAAELFEADARDLVQREEHLAAASVLARAERTWREVGDESAMQRAGLARAEALLAAGDGKSASDVISELERSGPVATDGLRARVVAAVATAQGNQELALQALQRASDAGMETMDHFQWFEVEFRLAEVLYALGLVQDAETHANMALELSTAIADSKGEHATLIEGCRIAQAATFLSKLRVELGCPEDAREALTQSLRHTAVLGDQASASRLLANLAYACAEINDPRAALTYAQRAFELAYQAGDRMAASRIAINLGAYEANLGHVNEALKAFSRAKTLARAVGWARGVRLSSSAAARLRLGMG